MDASALASALDNLEKLSSSLDWWLDFWTVLVVIGVAMELAVLIAEYTHEWRDFKRGIIHSPEKPSLLVFGLGLLGVGLVAIGVAGEFRVHVKAGKIETDIRSTSRQLVSLADGKAASAHERASENELALVQLKARMQWRVITREQQKHLYDVLRPTAPQSVHIGVLGTENPEVNEFADILWATLRPVWMNVGFTRLALLSGKDVAISVRSSAPKKATEAAMRLASELNRDGIKAAVVPEAEVDPNALAVLYSLLNLPPESSLPSDILILVGTRTF
jgi:hypothetical protein